MPNLSDSKINQQFKDRLDHLLRKQRFTNMTEYEDKFLTDMQERYEGREAQVDLGLTPWNPSANQWNYLANLMERYP